MEKKCFKCLEVKPLDDFYKHSEMDDGHLGKCKGCTKKDVRTNTLKRLDYYKEDIRKRYYYNVLYLLRHKYNCMKVRIRSPKYNCYKQPICTWDEFLKWTLEDKQYQNLMGLYHAWCLSNFQRTLCPTVDRIDTFGGYTVENMQWLNLHDNCTKYNKPF